MTDPNPGLIHRSLYEANGPLTDGIPKPVEKTVFVPSTPEVAEPHYTEPKQVFCKYCGSPDIVKYGIRNGVQEYIRKVCRRKFNEKETAFKHQTPVEQIASSLNSYYDGLSFYDIARNLAQNYNNPVAESNEIH